MKRTFSILGDSISTFEGCIPQDFRVYYEGERCEATGVQAVEDTWWAQVIAHLDGEFLANASYSGSMVEGAGFPAGNSDRRVAALAAGGRAPDVVIVFMGINDYGWGGAEAQAAGRGNALPECLDEAALGEPRVAGLAPADAAERFGEAYSQMLGRVRAAYPDAEVWCCTLCPGRVAGSARSTFAYNLRGVHFNRYNDAIRAAAAQRGCRVADVRAQGRDYEALDGTHPTARGMQQFAALVIAAMEAAGGAADGCGADAAGGEGEVDGAFGAPSSAEPCTGRPCVGCPQAASTSNQWLLVCQKR